MCGIAGFWRRSRGTQAPEAILEAMSSVLRHRGPDDSGSLFDASSGVGLSFRRLSILDLSHAGRQPMESPSGRYWIVFNGEVYNFQDLKSELGSTRQWRGHSDTEVTLAAIEKWGLEAAVERFVGMFSFALWDRQARCLYLVRDRLGIKPLYYGWVQGDFVFASELKAFHRYPQFAAEIDRDALALFMRHNYIPSPHAIYRDTFKLPPGSILSLSRHESEPHVRTYWSALEIAARGVRSPVTLNDDEAIETLEHKLTEAIRLRMIADVPLGAFLSGGIDSSTVVALMQAQSPRAVKTFTIGFHEAAYNEAAHAQRIAQYLGTDHAELYVTAQQALAVIPLLPGMYDEPFADVSQIPTYLVSKLARSKVTVSLAGDGGDELFAGYTRYAVMTAISKLPRPLRGFASQFLRATSPAAYDRFYRLAQPLVPAGRRLTSVGEKAHKLARLLATSSRASLYMHALTHWPDPCEVIPGAHEPETVKRFIESASGLPSMEMEEVMMLTDLANYLPDDILVKVDRASMAVSLEVRVPLLDHRVVEYSWRLPRRFKIRNGVRKWILRQVLYKHIPRALIERSKMGFGVPIDSWLRGSLRPWAEDLLSYASLGRHGFFNVEAIRSKWREHLTGSCNWQYLVWDVLVFQSWLSHHRQVTNLCESEKSSTDFPAGTSGTATA